MRQISLKEAFSGLDRAEKLRAYRRLWHEAERYEVQTDYPLHLDLELSGRCNLHCKDCFQSALDKKSLGLMSSELFQEIVASGVERGLCSIKLQIRGESMLHPELFELAAWAKRRGVLDVQLTTNGTLLDQGAVERILDSGLDGIIFSVDPRHEIAYRRAGSGQEYSRVPYYVNQLLEMRRERGSAAPWVRLKATSEDPAPAAMQQLKAELVQTFPLADIHIVGSIFNFRKDRDSFPGLRENYVLHPCAYLMQRMAVFWDGQATVCCMDYHGDFGLGSAAQQGVEEIWRSPSLDALRRAHSRGRREQLPICRHCHACVSAASDKVYVDQSPRNKLDLDLGRKS